MIFLFFSIIKVFFIYKTYITILHINYCISVYDSFTSIFVIGARTIILDLHSIHHQTQSFYQCITYIMAYISHPLIIILKWKLWYELYFVTKNPFFFSNSKKNQNFFKNCFAYNSITIGVIIKFIIVIKYMTIIDICD